MATLVELGGAWYRGNVRRLFPLDSIESEVYNGATFAVIGWLRSFYVGEVPHMAKETVLVVDDQEPAREMLRDFVESELGCVRV